VLPQGPDIAGARHGIGRVLGHIVGGIGLVAVGPGCSPSLAASSSPAGLDLARRRSPSTQIEVGQLQVFEFQRQQW
jgi:hypothetical protein